MDIKPLEMKLKERSTSCVCAYMREATMEPLSYTLFREWWGKYQERGCKGIDDM